MSGVNPKKSFEHWASMARKGVEARAAGTPAPLVEPIAPAGDVGREAQEPAANVDGLQGLQEVTLGELLTRSGKLSADAVPAILEYQQRHGGRFGDTAVALGYASSDDVLWGLAQQFHYPYLTHEPDRVFHQELVVATRPFGPEVEAFRDLRSHVLTTVMVPGQPKRALSVVSANIGDGKTFTAANLAVAFSQLPGRTLLVDCDMRSPRAHELFNLDGKSGLSNVLSGRSETSPISPIASLPNLFVMPGGVIPPNPSELLLRNAFGMVMRELIDRFDYVIVDTPAASHGSDAKLVAMRCGAALAVARRDRSGAQDIQSFSVQLAKSGVQLAGLVMNDG